MPGGRRLIASGRARRKAVAVVDRVEAAVRSLYVNGKGDVAPSLRSLAETETHATSSAGNAPTQLQAVRRAMEEVLPQVRRARPEYNACCCDANQQYNSLLRRKGESNGRCEKA
jgi:hypothetical protein